jgi:hypothetical protein
MTFEVSLRARILADLLERRRILAEAKRLRGQLRGLAIRRREFAAHVIAIRYQAKIRQVNALAASIMDCDSDHTDEK